MIMKKLIVALVVVIGVFLLFNICQCPVNYRHTCNQEEFEKWGFTSKFPYVCGCVLNEDFNYGPERCYRYDWNIIPPNENEVIKEGYNIKDGCEALGGYWFPPPPCMPIPFLSCFEVNFE